uniref:Uncharacterized protein n=1 Tax=Glossina austeni TaxID=7395 RepID=A0A1A9USI5_GLOAU
MSLCTCVHTFAGVWKCANDSMQMHTKLCIVNLDEAKTVVVRIRISPAYVVVSGQHNVLTLRPYRWIWKIKGLSPKNYLKLSKDFEMKILWKLITPTYSTTFIDLESLEASIRKGIRVYHMKE